MRLIDADELKREISHAIWLPEWEHIRDKVLKDIDLQPTAYDPDKVVEQLEDCKTKKYVSGITHNPYEFGACHAMDDAIEIVKKGGNV